jgi:predicted DNA-binding protein
VKRTTVKIPEELDALLRHEAARRGVKISQVTREALEAHLGGGAAVERFPWAGQFDSGRSDIASRVEELLWPTDDRA